ncbi:MAG: ABC transporter permease [Acidobacteria bacterium]|nr:ABC transporter permease [Acidobacteriota bacterium]
MSLLRRLERVLRPDRHNAEIDEELAFHLAMREEERRRDGLSEEEARRAARLQMGNPVAQREATHEAGIARWLEVLLQDLRYAARVLARTPALTAVVVASLALGIGANTSIFSLTYALLLRSLPVQNPGELYALTVVQPAGSGFPAMVEGNDAVTYAMWEGVRQRQQTFSSMFAWGPAALESAEGGESRPVQGAFITGDTFPTLGVGPALGRLIQAADDRTGSAPVAVLAYDYWARAYGADRGVLGRALILDGKSFTIVGVTPEGFQGLEAGAAFDVAVPLAQEPALRGRNSALERRNHFWLGVAGRLKPGVSAAAASGQLRSISAGVMEAARPDDFRSDWAESFAKQVLAPEPLSGFYSFAREKLRTPLLILMGAVVLVLLISCANVANLLLARTAARRPEMALRVALGASRGRVMRQVLTESALLSLAGAALGLAFAPMAARLLLQAFSPASATVSLNVRPDGTVLLFALGVSVVSALLFGSAPAWRASMSAPQTGMRVAAGAAGHGRLQASLVGGQVALSIVLLTGSVLMLTSLRHLMKAELGFQPEGVLLVDVEFPDRVVGPEQRAAFEESLLEALRRSPGVRSAAATAVTPLSGASMQMPATVQDLDGQQRQVHSQFHYVTPGYLETLRTALVAGRDFAAGDTATAPKVALVNESFAKRAFPGKSPIGRQIVTRIGLSPNGVTPVREEIEIVGLVRDAKYRSMREEPQPTFYLPIAQRKEPLRSVSYVLRSEGPAELLTSGVRAAAASLDPRLTFTARVFSTQIREATLIERFVSSLAAVFGGLALLLAAIGLYGVLSYQVAQRKGEIGVRMALGATPGDVRRWVFRHLGPTLAAGVALGVCGSYLAGLAARGLLYGVAPGDWKPYTWSVALLAAVVVAAGWLPARRASRLDPITALRHE